MTSITHSCGQWFVSKWRARLAESDTRTVARNMRKAGIPLEIALMILARRTA